MKEKIIPVRIGLILLAFFLGGIGVHGAWAQSDCGITVSYFSVLPSEVMVDGVLHKKVQVVVNNPNPGFGKRFYFVFDGGSRTEETITYDYGGNTEVFLVPVDVGIITFIDVNSPACRVDYVPNFTPNKCTFNFDQYIDLSAGDCYNRTVTYSVSGDVVIDSVAWLRNGNSTPVHDQMSWVNIPPGNYKIYFYDENGCEATTQLSTCTSSAEAGQDQNLMYCLGEDDTLNLYNYLTAGVDSGGFFTSDFISLDSFEASGLTYATEGVFTYYYIAPATLQIPDTSQFTLQVRDCSECAYELISASRHCADPEVIELTIGGGNLTDTTFRATLPDGAIVTQTFFRPFGIDFPHYSDTLELYVQWDTPAGICDSTLRISPVANPMIHINATEIPAEEDSVRIEVSIDRGTAPYQLDILVGDQQEYVEMGSGETRQITLEQASDTAILIALDEQGCMGTDTLIFTPDCLRPVVDIVHDVCETGEGQIVLDNSHMPAGTQIIWSDVETPDLWERTQLSAGAYSYTVSYDECVDSQDIVIEEGTSNIPELIHTNACLLDGTFEVTLEDSARAVQWSIGDHVLPYFSGSFPTNQELMFQIETTEGCSEEVTLRVDERPWLDQLVFTEPGNLEAFPGLETSELSDYGWSRRDTILCDNCLDYNEPQLQPGTYVFYAVQFPGCRRDTVLVVNEPELTFPMPNVITPTGNQNRMLQIFDPLGKMAMVMEFQVFDRFGNVLFQKFDFLPDDDATINWPNGSATELPNVIICIARIMSKEGEEVTTKQDVLILR